MIEIWKPIPIDGFNGLYEASNKGRIRSCTTKIVKFGNNMRTVNPSILNCNSITKSGYKSFLMSHNNKQIRCLVHRAVALAFHKNTENKKTVNHIDGNKENNNADNLEWATYKENMKHAMDNGLSNLPKATSKFIVEFSDYSKQKITGYDNVCKLLNLSTIHFSNKYYVSIRKTHELIYLEKYEVFINYLKETNNLNIGKCKIIQCIKSDGSIIEYKSLKEATKYNKNVSKYLNNGINKYGLIWKYKVINLDELYNIFS